MEDAAFLQAILANPADDVPRLIYADWLEERGDPRGEYLRLEVALAARAADSPEAQGCRQRLIQLRSQVESLWLACLDQPGVLRANPTPFPSGWWGVGLEGLREDRGTYTLYPYESLPPLPVDRFQGSFQWLENSTTWDRLGQVDWQSWQERMRSGVGRVTAEAARLNLGLPTAFPSFMENVEWLARTRSCTDCYFGLPARIAPSPAGEGGSLIRFYSDSQSCLHWYVYVTGKQYHCVVVSGKFYGGDWAWENEYGGSDVGDGGEEEQGPDELWFCAPSFEAFMYRWWIENEIWYGLSYDHHPLTPDEQVYVEHYRR